MKRKQPVLILILLVSILLTACSGVKTAAYPETTQTSSNEIPYPNSAYLSATQDGQSPYPESASPGALPTAYPYPAAVLIEPTTTPVPTSTADPSMGVVQGVILNANQPLDQAIIYLSQIKTDAKGTELAAALDPAESPRTATDEQGKFIFVNVPPGRYALIFYVVTDAFLLNYPDNGEPILLTVESGKTTDLGKLSYDDLPILGE